VATEELAAAQVVAPKRGEAASPVAGQRKGSIEVEVIPAPVVSKKVEEVAAAVPPKDLRPVEGLPVPKPNPSATAHTGAGLGIKGKAPAKPVVSESSPADVPAGGPKAVVSPRPAGALGMGRSAFGR
jgi:hypothetical protein